MSEEIDEDGEQQEILNQLDQLVQCQKAASYPREYLDSVKKPDALGILIAKYFEWSGSEILETFVSALEDANYHSLSAVIDQLEDLEAEQLLNITGFTFNE
jgi:hypothetical protein